MSRSNYSQDANRTMIAAMWGASVVAAFLWGRKAGKQGAPTSVQGFGRGRLSAQYSAEDVQALADAVGVEWDYDPDFMDRTERLTGKRHLHSLNEQELLLVAASLAPPSLRPQTAVQGFDGKTAKDYEREGKAFGIKQARHWRNIIPSPVTRGELTQGSWQFDAWVRGYRAGADAYRKPRRRSYAEGFDGMDKIDWFKEGNYAAAKRMDLKARRQGRHWRAGPLLRDGPGVDIALRKRPPPKRGSWQRNYFDQGVYHTDHNPDHPFPLMLRRRR